MKFNKLFIGLLLFIPSMLSAQQSNLFTSSGSNTQNNDTVKIHNHHAGWAFSYAAGTPTAGREALMISTIYSYSIEKWWDLEASLHYLGRSINAITVTVNGAPPVPFRFHATSWTFEATPMFHLAQTGFFQPFRLGLGISLHSLTVLNNGRDFVEPDLIYHFYSNAVYVGGTFKLEYNIPLSQRVDIGIRGQLSLYPAEFQGINQLVAANVNSVGFGGLGIFARFNW